MLEQVFDFLVHEVRPKAELIDGNVEALREAMDGLAQLGALSLKRPLKYGGPELPEADFRRFQEEVARASGALAFLQTQHQSAVSLLSKSPNESLKAEILPKTHDGGVLIGVGFSQLRRSGRPLVKAKSVDGGYSISGHIPWSTGAGIFDLCLIGAVLDSGEHLFGLIPFLSQTGISVSPPMELAAMESAQTVTIDMLEYFIPEERIVAVKSANWIHQNDLINIVLQGFFAIGCASAGLDVVDSAIEKRPSESNKKSLENLRAEVAKCRDSLFVAQAMSEETTEEKLRLRAWSIELAVKCAHAAIAASGGSANSKHHPAQRIYREALVYTVSAQTTAIQEATLRKISES